MAMKPIFLIGYMGSGKSTLGRTVSQLTGMPFIDLDTYVEGRYHMSVREIFDKWGEDGFRQRERAMLAEVADFENTLIACGGGTPCFFDNMDVMNAKGITVWLDTGIDRLHQRLMRGRHKRPLIAGMDSMRLRQFITDSLVKREPYYSKAAVRFQSDLLDCETEKAETASRFINEIINRV